MKCFYCAHCGMMVFFENDHCVKCGRALGFMPKILDLCALKKTADNLWRGLGPAASTTKYRNCSNGTEHGVCNWLVPADDPHPLCLACRLNEIIPALTGANVRRWAKLELAKRRCLYSCLRLGLPVPDSTEDNPSSLRFRFLEQTDASPVKTGHDNGVITINIAEADDDERERQRINLKEPYRTLVGHFRHESGHYYWNLLIANTPSLSRFRELFGGETADYPAALEVYYQQGPPADWATRCVTPYAAAHPWEDWAETWAHYLHIVDTLESAADFNLSVKQNGSGKTGTGRGYAREPMDFDHMLEQWTPLVCALNAINRGMGLADLYPFVIPPPVVEKLRFIQQVVRTAKSSETGTLAVPVEQTHPVKADHVSVGAQPRTAKRFARAQNI